MAQALPEEEMQIEVIDDCSSDGDVEALVNELGDKRVRFFKQVRNVGSLRNFETCINKAKGELVHILHGDDVVKPGFYQEIDGLFKKYSDIGAAFTHYEGFDENSTLLWGESKVSEESGIVDNWLLKVAQGNMLQAACIVVKRSVYENLGSFFGVHYGEDWEMWTRIAAYYDVAYSPKSLALYRIHSNNITGRSFATGQNVKEIATVIDIIQNYLPENQRKILKSKAKSNYAGHVVGMSHELYKNNQSKIALLQALKAFQLYQNKRTLLSLVKISVKILIGYKGKVELVTKGNS